MATRINSILHHDGNGKTNGKDMTDREVRKLGEALQDPHFRHMLADYAREVTREENVAQYEAEVAQVSDRHYQDVTVALLHLSSVV